jgi:glycosyltransferase involved in cell wall biosynthesis
MYRKLDRKKFQFDFLVTRDEVGVFDEEIKELGGRVYRIPSVRDVGLISFVRNVDKFFNDYKEYNIVHSHMNTWSGLFLRIAKKHGVKVRIAQSHSAQQGHKQDHLKEKFENIFKKIMRFLIKYNATHFWAVGQAAGEWLFGRKIATSKMLIFPNAKDVEKYRYNKDERLKIRNMMGLSDEVYLIGHVGSFSYVKNHNFILEIIKKLIIIDQNIHLIFIGDGNLKVSIEKSIHELKLDKYISLLGLRDDVHLLMSAMDLLILPSIFEGVPNVLIEAQMSSLPSIASSTINPDADFQFGLIEYVPISESVLWVNKILSKRTNFSSREFVYQVDEKYDINKQIKFLQDFYDEFVSVVS